MTHELGRGTVIPTTHEPGRDLLRQARRHSLIAIEPRHRLDRRATARARHPRARKHQPCVPLAERRIAEPAFAHVGNRRDRFAAVAAPLHVGRLRLQHQHELRRLRPDTSPSPSGASSGVARTTSNPPTSRPLPTARPISTVPWRGRARRGPRAELALHERRSADYGLP